MPTIEFKITEGKAPFFAEILEGGIPLVYCPTVGTWFFNDVECGVSYTIRVTDAENCTVEFQAECECTTTVEPTTTEAPTTTSEPTTTVIEELPCNYYDTEYFTPFVTQKNYTLGADTGVVELYFNFFDIPARIVIEFDGSNVIDTGYRGNPAYQTQLNTALTSLGEPPAVISNTREGRLYFEKETATESAVMYIYAPIGGAVVTYSLKCPADPVFAATFTNYVCEQEEYVPTTTVELTTTEPVTTTEETMTTILEPTTTEQETTTSEQVATTEQLLTTTVLFTTTEEVTTTVELTTTNEITTTETPTTTVDPLYNCVEYGYLYNWWAANDVRKISSSDDWYIPTLQQYRGLADHLGANGDYTTNNVGAKLKTVGSGYWNSPTGNETNEYGFNAKGAGVRYVNLNPTASWQEFGVRMHMLCKDRPMESATYAVSIYDDALWAVVGYFDEPTGGSIRLIKDATGLADGTTTTYIGNNGQEYNAVVINELYWITENLIETEYRNGDPIPTVEDATTWAGLTTGGKCAYNNNYEYVGCGETAPVTTTEEITTTAQELTTTNEATTTQEVTTTEAVTTTNDITTTVEQTTTEEVTTTI